MRNYLTLTATNNAIRDCVAMARPCGETSLSDEQAAAFAKICKHVTIGDLKQMASSDSEAYVMHEALAKVRNMLADASIVDA